MIPFSDLILETIMGFLMPACVFALGLFYINEPVVTIREHPSQNSRILVSQVLYAEKIKIEKELGEWAYITTDDDYSGWIPQKACIGREIPYIASVRVSRLAAHVYSVEDTEFGPILTLPFGSPIQVLDDTNKRWFKIALLDGREGYIQKGDTAPESKLGHKADLVAFSQKFLGLPYTWGGRSSFGYDCSGFIQMLYDQINIHLLSEAKQQIEDSRFRIISLNELEPGDLIFFGASPEKITHVGMSVGEESFIHAIVSENQPWIRISSLSDFEWSGHEKATCPYRTARQLIDREDNVPN